MAATYRRRGFDYAEKSVDHFIPTLYIGLGGTGTHSLMRFRKLLYDEHGQVALPFARMICFDTDMQEGSDIPKGEDKVEEQQNKAIYDPVRLRKDKREWISIELVDELEKAREDFMKKKDHRYLRWLHPDFFTLLPRDAAKTGSGGYRQAGRLAFFVHYARIRGVIESQLEDMVDYMKNPERQKGQHWKVYNNRVEVVIIASIAGGTGAGMFLDMAYLVRDILKSEPQFERLVKTLDLTGIDSEVTFIASLPTAYAAKDPAMADRFRVNAYAALLEMEHYNTPRPEDNFFKKDERGIAQLSYRPIQFRVNWEDPGGVEKVIEDRPWDACYLIEDVNDLNRGKKRALSDVHQMIADYLFMDLGNNPFSLEKRSLRSNHAGLRSAMVTAEVHDSMEEATDQNEELARRDDNILYENKYGCSFSSFGLSEIYIDCDRIARCGGYELASWLIQKRWINREDAFGDNDYNNWADADLHQNETTGQAEELTFQPEELARAVLKEGDHDWIQWVESTFDRLDQLDPSTVSLETLASQFRSALTRIGSLLQGQLVDSAELKMTIKQTLERRSRQLRGTGEDIGPLRRRLDRRSRVRLSQLGTVPTCRLLQQYAEELKRSREKASKWARQPTRSVGQLVARLTDALHVPFPCKKIAVRIEYRRACREARTEVLKWCRKAAAQQLDAIYHDALLFVSPGSSDLVHGSLYDRYEQWRKLLKRVCDSLDKEFELCRQQPKTDRRIPLLPNWNEQPYRTEINVALLKHAEVGPDADETGAFDWDKAEKVILRTLSSKSVCEAVEQWYETWKVRADSLAEIMNRAGSACRSPLGEKFGLRHFANGNVVDYLMSLPEVERDTYLIPFIEGSAPYLPSIGNTASSNLDPVWRNLLGMTANPDRPKNATLLFDEIRGKASKESKMPRRDDIRDTRAFNESKLVLLRELGRIPIHFYDRLNDLHQGYFERTQQEFRLTCHIRYRETVEDLPDIEIIDADEYDDIGKFVNSVVRAVLLKFIQCSEDGMFFAKVPEEFRARTYELGSRFNRIVKHACRRKEVRTFAQNQWAKWSKQVATAKHLAVLYNAIQQNMRQFPSTIPAGQSSGDEMVWPMWNCFRKLLARTKQDLLAAQNGDAFFDLLRRPDDMAPDLEDRTSQFEALCQHIRETCLVPACINLPILQIDRGKIDAVHFPCEQESHAALTQEDDGSSVPPQDDGSSSSPESLSHETE